MTKVLTSAVLVGLLVTAPVARAQFIGGAAPAGAPNHVFTVTGVAHAAGLSTIFTCTNTSPGSVNVAVQTFDQNGSAQNASPALSVPPGGTAQFATTSTAPFSPDQYLSPVSSFTRGSAKIWSSGRTRLVCGALAWASGSIANLTIVAKIKQKGD